MRVMGRAMVAVALLTSLSWSMGQAGGLSGGLVLPQALELSDTELAGVEGSAAANPAWIQQLQQTCAATPQTTAACSALVFAGGMLLAALHHESRDLIAEEFIRPWWEPFFARPLRDCGPFGWKCW